MVAKIVGKKFRQSVGEKSSQEGGESKLPTQPILIAENRLREKADVNETKPAN
jgi:hypothetical protein